MVGGFDQGGALALLVAYHMYHRALDGAISLSSFAMPVEKKHDLAAFLYHGAADNLIPCKVAEKSYKETLNDEGIIIEKGLGHEVSPTEMMKLKKFLLKLN